MNYEDFLLKLKDSSAKNGINPPTDTEAELFFRFTEHLLATNAHTNLTAIREPIGMIDKHYIDSLLVSHLIPRGSRVLDLGCGPGFPSVPLAITREDLQIVALDSTAKKITFVEETAKTLDLSNLNAVSARAEDATTRKNLGKFDIVVSRAVARLNILCELSLPYLCTGGQLIALKGAKFEEELAEASHAISVLGGKVVDIHRKNLILSNGNEEARGAIVIEAIKPAPTQYPRAYAAIMKKPL